MGAAIGRLPMQEGQLHLWAHVLRSPPVALACRLLHFLAAERKLPARPGHAEPCLALPCFTSLLPHRRQELPAGDNEAAEGALAAGAEVEQADAPAGDIHELTGHAQRHLLLI